MLYYLKEEFVVFDFALFDFLSREQEGSFESQPSSQIQAYQAFDSKNMPHLGGNFSVALSNLKVHTSKNAIATH